MSLMNKESKTLLREFINKAGLNFIEISNEKSFIKIYDLFTRDNMFEPENSLEELYIARYFRLKFKKNQNKDDLIKSLYYYNKSVESLNSDAMYDLGNFYKEHGKYEKMKKMYKLSYECNNVYGLLLLAYYYKQIKKYKKMIQYYIIAIKWNNTNAMLNLGVFYYEIGDFKNMEKYYKMALFNGNKMAIYNLMNYYQEKGLDNEMILVWKQYNKIYHRVSCRS